MLEADEKEEVYWPAARCRWLLCYGGFYAKADGSTGFSFFMVKRLRGLRICKCDEGSGVTKNEAVPLHQRYHAKSNRHDYKTDPQYSTPPPIHN